MSLPGVTDDSPTRNISEETHLQTECVLINQRSLKSNSVCEKKKKQTVRVKDCLDVKTKAALRAQLSWKHWIYLYWNKAKSRQNNPRVYYSSDVLVVCSLPSEASTDCKTWTRLSCSTSHHKLLLHVYVHLGHMWHWLWAVLVLFTVQFAQAFTRLQGSVFILTQHLQELRQYIGKIWSISLRSWMVEWWCRG